MVTRRRNSSGSSSRRSSSGNSERGDSQARSGSRSSGSARRSSSAQSQSRPSRSSRGSGDGNRSSSRGSNRGSNRPRQSETMGKSSYLGREGREQAQRERDNIAQRREAARNRVYAPFRFWMPPNTEREIIVLDRRIIFYRYEHALFNPQTGRNDLYLPCVNQEDGCAVCHSGDNAYYAMFLSVIDTEGYENNNGDWVDWSRKLFPVKSGMQNTWIRLEDREADGDEGLRGARIRVLRDGDKDPRTGNEIEFMDFESEDNMEQYIREYQDRDNNLKEEDCREAYDYQEIMPEMSEEAVAIEAGVDMSPRTRTRRNSPSQSSTSRSPTPGSREEEEAELDDRDDDDETVPWQEGDEEEQWDGETDSDDDQQEPEQEEERPRASRGSRGSASSGRQRDSDRGARPRAGSSGSRSHGADKEVEEPAQAGSTRRRASRRRGR